MSFGYKILGFGTNANAGWDYMVDYLVVAGGGGGGKGRGGGGGGGAGGYRTSFPGGTMLQLAAGTYPVSIGGGGGSNSGEGGTSTFNPGGSEGVNMITSTYGGGGETAAEQTAISVGKVLLTISNICFPEVTLLTLISLE